MFSISISVILFVLVNYSNLSQSTVFAKVTGIIKMCSGKTEMSIDVLFAQQWFSSQSSAMEAIFAPFAPSLCYGRGRNSDLNWGWQIFGRCCEVFGDLLDELLLHSWANVGHPLLQRFTTVPCFLHVWMTALTGIQWSPKDLEMVLQRGTKLQLMQITFGHIYSWFFWILSKFLAFENLFV